MGLQASQVRRLEDQRLTETQRALLRCHFAKKFEESGNYEAAREAMGDLWDRVGRRPKTEDLSPDAAAEVLMRAGTLSGWIASTAQIEAGQEPAKDLLSESIRAFTSLGLIEKSAEASVELAYCYWREGNYDEALVWLDEADKVLVEGPADIKGLSLIRRSIAHFGKGNFAEAVKILESNARLFDESTNHALKGKFHVSLGSYLKKISEIEKSEATSDRALLEYTAASYHFEMARHHVYRAGIENQLGFLFAAKGRFDEAHEHLNRARRLFRSLRDKVHAAQVDETRAKTFLRQANYPEAEKAARAAVSVLERGGHQALLAEALTTLGTSQARLGRFNASRFTLRKAAEVAEQVNDLESAARAEITVLEELLEGLNPEETAQIYNRADQHLARSNNAETLARLRACAVKIIKLKRETSEAATQGRRRSRRLLKPEEVIQNADRLTEPDQKIDWDGFSLRDALRRLEGAYIERALYDSGGSVTRAARLLGLPNHNLVTNRLQTKGKDLANARTPAKPRRKSIIKKKGH